MRFSQQRMDKSDVHSIQGAVVVGKKRTNTNTSLISRGTKIVTVSRSLKRVNVALASVTVKLWSMYS